MKVKIYPGGVQGSIVAPASKSLSQRALAAALLRPEKTILSGVGRSEDELAALEIIKALGAEVRKNTDNTLEVSSAYPHNIAIDKQINCGESGLSLRMFTPIAALTDKEITVQGHGSLLQRPLGFSAADFQQLSIAFSTKAWQLPFTLKGPLQPRDIHIDGQMSSQFLSGLLLAFSAAGAAGVTIYVKNLKSKPYIDLTLAVMESLGFPIPKNHNYEAFYFTESQNREGLLDTRAFTIEGDWSGAAFLMAAGAVAGNAQIRGLDVFSRQGDKKILEALMEYGCGLSVRSEEIAVSKLSAHSFYFDANQCPDLFPPLVALATQVNGKSVINGVSRLQFKESNRAESLKKVFEKLGVSIHVEENQMIIEGHNGIQGGTVHAHGDHRIVMACAVAALNASGPVTIKGAEAVRKSYPGFFGDLKMLGVQMEVLEN